MLTVAPVIYERFEIIMINGCVWHFTHKGAAYDMYTDGWIRAGRDAIYFVYKCQFAQLRPEYKNHPQVVSASCPKGIQT